MRYLLFLIPHFWIHEGGHFLAALIKGKILKFYYSEGKLGNLTIPRYCWNIPTGLTTEQENFILKAGFKTEFAATILFVWCVPLAVLYLIGAIIHKHFYISYGGNPREV